MKFVNRQTEEAYLARSQPGLIKRTAGFSKVVVVFMIAMIVLFAILRQRASSALAQQLLAMQMCACALLALLGCGAILAMRFSSCWVQLVRPPTLEAAVTTMGIISMCVMILGSRPTLCRMLGRSLQEVMGDDAYDSDSFPLMAIQGVSVAMHVGVPVRWCSLLPLQAACVGLYIVSVFAIGSSEPPLNVYSNIILLTSILVATSLGKRALELLERKGFLDIIQEKQARCQAEFQLSQAEDRSRGRGQPSDPAAASSLASRAAGSSNVFDPRADESRSLTDHLDHLAQVGILEHWRIDDDHVTVLEDQLLGSGGFGQVHKGVFCGKLVAVKRPRIKAANTDVQTLGGICSELRVTRHLQHPNIVTTYGALVRPRERSVALVMELVDGVRLSDLMLATAGGDSCRSKVSLVMQYQIMMGVCEALFYMHTRSPRVVHGDLKGDNVMVTLWNGTAHPKLLDFGLSRVLTKNARPLGGTLTWMAPEARVCRHRAKCSADIYSLGHVIAFTATGTPPGRGLAADAIRQFLRRPVSLAPKWPSSCPFTQSCKPLVSECINTTESDRPEIGEVHRRLLSLPEEETLSEMKGPFIDSLRLVAQRAPPSADQPPLRAEQQDPTAPALPAAQAEEQPPQDRDNGSLRNPLGSLPEEQAVEGEGQNPAPPSPTRPAKLQPFAGLNETCREARLATLDLALGQWNYEVPKGFCCERHALARLAVADLHQERLAKPCTVMRLWRPDKQVQCEGCGLLLREGTEECAACGRDQPGPSGSTDGWEGSDGAQSLRTAL